MNGMQVPVTKRNWRVEDYQSVMAVRPTLHPDKPGVEFSVTAFEDPGVALPDSIINWYLINKFTYCIWSIEPVEA